MAHMLANMHAVWGEWHGWADKRERLLLVIYTPTVILVGPMRARFPHSCHPCHVPTVQDSGTHRQRVILGTHGTNGADLVFYLRATVFVLTGRERLLNRLGSRLGDRLGRGAM